MFSDSLLFFLLFIDVYYFYVLVYAFVLYNPTLQSISTLYFLFI